MKIAINTLSEDPLAPSGAFGYYQNLIWELDKIISGEDILYIFVSKKSSRYFGPYENPRLKNIVFQFSNERRFLRVMSEHILFPYVVWKYGIDVLQSGTTILYCPCKLLATFKTMHVYTNPQSISFLTRLYRRSAYWMTKANAGIVIANSNKQAEDIAKYTGIKKSKIRIVYEAFDHSLFRLSNTVRIKENPVLQRLGINKPYILFVSSLFGYKNAETLIEAYYRLGPDFQKKNSLVIVGYPRDRSYFNFLRNLVRRRVLNSSVVFTGGLDQEAIAKLYQSAFIFVYPSYYETFGLTILEAMACGCPVIASNVGSIPEIGGKAANYFIPESPDELAETLLELSRNKKLRKQQIERGLKRVKYFSWAKTARSTLFILKST